MPKGVNSAEPETIETLDLETVSVHDWNRIEYVRLGVLPEDAAGPNGTVSFQLVQFGKEYRDRVKSLQANLTYDEIDIVIDGLQKAKKRMEALRGEDKHNENMEWLNEEISNTPGPRGEIIYLLPHLEIHPVESSLDGGFSARALRIIADEMERLADEQP